mmetsp:Transcript_33104/g.66404  ORF Transcript_33104/g.66404 Transcript_33104/m.66404 type:complete len:114 (+) Transcript_33104:1-342(+)
MRFYGTAPASAVEQNRAAGRHPLLYVVVGFCALLSVVAVGWAASHQDSPTELTSFHLPDGDTQWEHFKDFKVQSALKGLLDAEDKQRSLMNNLQIENKLHPSDVGDAFAGVPQ